MSTMLLLGAQDVDEQLRGGEESVLRVVADAYRRHEQGRTAVPHAAFIPLSDDCTQRVIALPAFVDDDTPSVGIKWIASFPGNVDRGLDRASAIIVLNSMQTGRPEVVLEGAGVSAARTAASAAVAVGSVRPRRAYRDLGLIGCGRINLTIVRYLRAAGHAIERITVHDLDHARAAGFAEHCRHAWPGMRTVLADDVDAVLSRHELVSLATTAPRPHIASLDACPRGALVLHVSLRDIAPEAMLRCDNVVDDVDHVCRAQTSVHLAEQTCGDRAFIRASLGALITGTAPPCRDPSTVTVVSPFGLGALDVAVARWVADAAIRHSRGVRIESFFGPEPIQATEGGHDHARSPNRVARRKRRAALP